MSTRPGNAEAARSDHTDCCGCSLCLLVCPVWRHSHDLGLTPHGRAKALQHGVAVAELAASVESCSLCGACSPVCPEEIDPVDMMIQLRRELSFSVTPAPPSTTTASSAAQMISSRVFLPDAGLLAHPETLAKILALLCVAGDTGAAESSAKGSDIALALESGAFITQQRLQRFLAPLRTKKTIIVADGLLFHYLRRWLPDASILTLGEALSRLAQVRRNLRATDLYVIETRAYHADYQRLVKYYDGLRRNCGCDLNLDLQRIAIPATVRNLPQRLGRIAPDDAAQIHWLLQGRKMSRIVVENFEDYAALAEACACPVVHVAELVDLAKVEGHAHG